MPHELVLRNQDGTWLIDWTAEAPGGTSEHADPANGTAGAAPDAPAGSDGSVSPEPEGSTSLPLPPEDLVRAFYDMAEAADCPGLITITTPEYWGLGTFTADETDMLDACEQGAAEQPARPQYEVQNIELNDSVQDGSSGWATVEVTVDGVPETHELDLQAEDDGYLIRDLTNL